MISIIIPVLNEENAIAETIKACQKVIYAIGDSNSEIIVVDDASNDKTNDNASQTGVTIIRHLKNEGYGKSLKDGIIASKNDTIEITDADGTYPVETIPKLLKVFKEGKDMVVGARQWKSHKEFFFKKSSRKILHSMVEYSTGKKVGDVNSGMRIFSKKTVLPILSELCDTFSFTTSLTLAYMMTGKSVVYMPVEYKKRIGKTKVRPFRDSLITLKYVFKALNKYNPIKLLQLFLILMILIGLVAMGISLIWLSEIILWASVCCAIFSMIAWVFVVFLLKRK